MPDSSGRKAAAFLKIGRLSVSLLILLLFVLYFSFDTLLPAGLGNFLTSFQLLPVLWKSILAGFTTAIFGLAGLVGLTLLLGRIYCSGLCPLGTMQDGVIFFSRIFGLKRKFRFRLLPAWPRYLVLGITLLTFLLGSSTLIGILDPYSSFGRLTLEFVKPLAVHAQNGLGTLLKSWEIYDFTGETLPVFPWTMLLFSGFYLALVTGLALFMGRTYCNTLCPVGTLLSLLARFSLFRLTFIAGRCTQCGRCEQVCKSECINSKQLQLDRSRCVNCFNCLKACPHQALTYGLKPAHASPSKRDAEGNSRRIFLRSSATLLLAGLGSLIRPPRLLAEDNSPAATGKRPLLSFPPGGEELTRFRRLCTACQLCVAKCPTRVLTADLLANGWQGTMQPYLNYDQSFCEYECNICTQVCPSGALKNLTLKEKQHVQLGQVNFTASRCVVVTKGTACGACAEICPTHAVYMIPYINNLTIPAIETTSCIGCGGCQSVCPVRPEKAILVDSLTKHGLAADPIIRPNQLPAPARQRPSPAAEDFPF